MSTGGRPDISHYLGIGGCYGGIGKSGDGIGGFWKGECGFWKGAGGFTNCLMYWLYHWWDVAL